MEPFLLSMGVFLMAIALILMAHHGFIHEKQKPDDSDLCCLMQSSDCGSFATPNHETFILASAALSATCIILSFFL